tara:strand:+ start:14509 stop:15483 length:975 start_codon:yes stop_codon:yes gene_type:complete
MKNLVPIIAGDPNSINSEIIAKFWKKRSHFKNINVFIIGNYLLIKKQLKIIGLKINLKKISEIENKSFEKELLIYDVPLKFKNAFKVPVTKKSNYILNCFKIAIKLKKEKKIIGIVNCPINKKETFGKNFFGVTEFLAKKEGVLGQEVMLIYNKELSVSPVTTHIKLKKVPSSISKKKIIKKLLTINNFFLKNLGIKPKIGVLGLNPHNDELRTDSEEKKFIVPAIKELKKKKVSVDGPLSPDTAFLNYKKDGFNVLVGMYHDQVLSPFKTIFKFKAINLTLGIPYIRVSPDHGVGKNILRKNLANPESLINAIKFFNNKNAKT